MGLVRDDVEEVDDEVDRTGEGGLGAEKEERMTVDSAGGDKEEEEEDLETDGETGDLGAEEEELVLEDVILLSE